MVAMSESGLRRRTSSRPASDRGRDRQGRDAPEAVLRDVREKAADVAQRLVSGTREVKEQVMAKTSEVTRAVADGVKEEAERFFDEQKGKLAGQAKSAGKMINQAAHALHAVKADSVAEAVDAAADRMKRASQYIEDRTLGDLVSDTADLARRYPGLVLGGLFVTGLVAARFAKASADREEGESEGGGKGRQAASARNGRNGRPRGR